MDVIHVGARHDDRVLWALVDAVGNGDWRGLALVLEHAELDDDPGLVNSDPYGAGWLFKVTLADDDGETPPGLLTAAEYTALTKDPESDAE